MALHYFKCPWNLINAAYWKLLTLYLQWLSVIDLFRLFRSTLWKICSTVTAEHFWASSVWSYMYWVYFFLILCMYPHFVTSHNALSDTIHWKMVITFSFRKKIKSINITLQCINTFCILTSLTILPFDIQFHTWKKKYQSATNHAKDTCLLGYDPEDAVHLYEMSRTAHSITQSKNPRMLVPSETLLWETQISHQKKKKQL